MIKLIKFPVALLSLLVFLMLQQSVASACDDFYLEWRKLEMDPIVEVPDGVLGVSEAVARLRTMLKIERIIKKDQVPRLVFAFIGWGEGETPADKDQIEAVNDSFALFFPEEKIICNKENLVEVPDYKKMSAVLSSAADNEYAVSFIVRQNKMQWQYYLTKDLSSMFKLRVVLKEWVKAECKLVNKAGRLVYFDTFEVKPSLLSDFNYETNGFVEMNAERYGSDLIMNVIAENLPEPITQR
ncbi:MAG: hypothetical protein ACQETH_09735 [Candidatus Rifleibacteriota bacterium]